jgi:hypothetical protein
MKKYLEFVVSHISKSRYGAPSDGTKSSGQRPKSIFRNGVDRKLSGIPPISAKNAEMDGAQKSTAKEKRL